MGLFGLGAKQLGEIEVPGSGTLEFPAGKVKIRYVEDRKGRSVDSDGKFWYGPHSSLVVTILAGGQPLEIMRGRRINEGAVGGKIYREYGSIQLDAPASCEIRTEMQIDDGDFHSPRIAFRA